MKKKSPFSVIRSRFITEKATVLANLAESESNAYVKKCKTPKAVFLVDPKATKQEIAEAIKQIYKNKKVKVIAVNTINVKPKKKRKRTRVGREGRTKSFKKAIVTFSKETNINEMT